jgi:hypothetical protein
MSNHNLKIQDFYASKNKDSGCNILDERGFFTRNTEEINTKQELPFLTLINNSKVIINSNTNTTFEKNSFEQGNRNNNNRDIANQRMSQLSPFNNNVTDYKYLTQGDFKQNNNDFKQNNNNDFKQNNNFMKINTQNTQTYIDDRNMFSKNNNTSNFKHSHNNRLSELGQLPNNSAFPINNNRNMYEIKSINTRNLNS